MRERQRAQGELRRERIKIKLEEWKKQSSESCLFLWGWGEELILEGHKRAFKNVSNGLFFNLGDWCMEVCLIFKLFYYFTIQILPRALHILLNV